VIGLVAAALVAGCFLPPVDAPVVDPFRAPACEYCAGNRGIEYGPREGQVVRAGATGVVTFAGSVAGTRYVVVEHPDGLRMTYGKLATSEVAAGQRVLRGQRVGTTTTSLFVGLRRGDEYLDPAPLLGTLRYRTRLVPSDGSRPRLAPPPRLVCPSVVEAVEGHAARR
jgi:murein DD-endopeptidase MepM/ murein hydrolase activator NlpD